MKKISYNLNKSLTVFLDKNSVSLYNSRKDNRTEIQYEDINQIRLFSQMGYTSCIIRDRFKNKIHIYFSENLADAYRERIGQGTKEEFSQIIKQLHILLQEKSPSTEFIEGTNTYFYLGLYFLIISVTGLIFLVIAAQSIDLTNHFMKMFFICCLLTCISIFLILKFKNNKNHYDPKRIPL